jgi:hypothetical protein
MRRVDLTRDFQAYRDATRLIWNTFLCDIADQEERFSEIDTPLFHVILENRINRDLKSSTMSGTAHYPNLEVRSPESSALFLSKGQDVNYWPKNPLPKRIRLRYVELFDFASYSGVNRDFEYLKCISTNERGDVGPESKVLLVLARTATVRYIEYAS